MKDAPPNSEFNRTRVQLVSICEGHSAPVNSSAKRGIVMKMIILLFIIAKLALYTFWCSHGIRLLAPSRMNATVVAFGLACVLLNKAQRKRRFLVSPPFVLRTGGEVI